MRAPVAWFLQTALWLLLTAVQASLLPSIHERALASWTRNFSVARLVSTLEVPAASRMRSFIANCLSVHYAARAVVHGLTRGASGEHVRFYSQSLLSINAHL
jgi:hypothetical protein